MLERIIEKQIGGGSYRIVPLAARNGGLEVFRKLHGHLAPILGALAEAVRYDADAKPDDKIKIDPEKVVAAVRRAVEQAGSVIANDEFSRLVDKMFTTCTFNGQRITPDHWDSHLGDHDQVVGWLLWVNFLSPFFGNATSLQALADRLQDKFPVLRTSTPGAPAS